MYYDKEFKKSTFSQHGWGKKYCVEVKRDKVKIN